MGAFAAAVAERRQAAKQTFLAILFAYRDAFLGVPLLLWVVYHWLQTAGRIARYYSPLPYMDYWRVPQFLARYRAFDLRVLWLQHNDHRIVFPEIVFAADMLLFRGRQLLPLCFSIGCYLAILTVFAWILQLDKRLSFTQKALATLLAAIIMGWQGSAVFLAETFLLQWTLLLFAALAALTLLALPRQPANNSYFLASMGFAEVATFCSGNGILVWPLLLAAGAVLRLPRKRMWQLAVVGAASIALYFTGYKLSGNLNLKNFFVHPLYTWEFAGAYLGMPFSGIFNPMFGVRVGLLGVGIAALLFFFTLRRGLAATPTSVIFFGLYLLGLWTAALTAAGRMDPSDPNFILAKPARYLAVPLLNWAILAVLLIWTSAVCRWKFLSPAKLCVLVALFLLFTFPKLRWWLRDQDGGYSDRQVVTLAMRAGLLDPNLSLKIFPDANFVNTFEPELREGRLSVFADRRYRLIGTPLTASFPMSKSPGFGAVTYVSPVHGGMEVAGWADTSRDNDNAREVVLVNESGHIVGFGSKLGDLYPVKLTGLGTPPSLGWVGFVNLAGKSTSFSAYLIKKHDLMALGGPVSIPN